jgi:hypothetical protein
MEGGLRGVEETFNEVDEGPCVWIYGEAVTCDEDSSVVLSRSAPFVLGEVGSADDVLGEASILSGCRCNETRGEWPDVKAAIDMGF